MPVEHRPHANGNELSCLDNPTYLNARVLHGRAYSHMGAGINAGTSTHSLLIPTRKQPSRNSPSHYHTPIPRILELHLLLPLPYQPPFQIPSRHQNVSALTRSYPPFLKASSPGHLPLDP